MDIEKRRRRIVKAVGKYLIKAAKALVVSKLIAIFYSRNRKS